jgi:hypothetical protein
MLPDLRESLAEQFVNILMPILKFSMDSGQQPSHFRLRQGHHALDDPFGDFIRAGTKWAQEHARPVRSQSGTDASGLDGSGFH